MPDSVLATDRVLDSNMEIEQSAVTELLQEMQGGNKEAAAKLLPHIYDELRAIARAHLRREHNAQTLQATALVHEAYIRLLGQQESSWQNRTHFFSLASQIIRRVLVDHARAKRAQKRGGDQIAVTYSEEFAQEAGASGLGPQNDILALDEAINALMKRSERQAKIVELKFFAGLTNEEIATVVGASPATVKRDWLVARAFLARELEH